MPAPESAVLSRIAAVGRRSVGWRALRVLLLTLLTAVALTTPAHAKKKGNWGEASAKRLIKKAMNEDYFDTYYDEAEKKLKRAVQICRDKGCRKKLQARIWQYLGAVYANGLDDVDSASAAFLKMLMLNKQLKPDRKFRSDATDEAFETAREQYNEIAKVELEARKKRIEAEEAEKKRKAAEKAARDKARREKKAAAKRKKELARLKREEEKRAADEKQAAIDAEKARIKAEKKEAARVKRCEIDVPLDLIAAPWVEQAVGYPLPVAVGIPKLPSKTMKVKSVVVNYMSASRTSPGKRKLKYDKKNKVWSGYLPCDATKEEGEVTYWITATNTCDNIVAVSGDAVDPILAQVKPAIDYKQPHLPGKLPPEVCKETGPKKLSCDETDDCPEDDQVCSGGFCKTKKKKSKKKPEKPTAFKRPQHRIGLFASADFSPISATSDEGACTPESIDSGKYSCFFPDGGFYNQKPNPGRGGEFSTVAPGTFRISLQYEYVLMKRMTVGGRLGIVIPGRPEREDGSGLLPIHVEGRFAFYIWEDPFVSMTIRPYAAFSLGVGNTYGRIDNVEVRDVNSKRFLNVYQTGGPLYGQLALGLEVPIFAQGQVNVEFALRQSLGNGLTTIVPTLGYIHSF